MKINLTIIEDKVEEEKENIINEKPSQLLIHHLLKQIKLVKLLWDFDSVSLYPSVMWDGNNIYPRKETGHAFTEDMNAELVEKINTAKSTQGSAILKNKYYNPKILIVQHLPVKEREKKIENNHMRNGYFIDTLTSADIQETVKLGGKVIQIDEGVTYRKNFRVGPFRKVIGKLYASRQKYKKENNDVRHFLVKLLMNSL